MVGALTLLSPWGATASLAAVLPLLAIVVSATRAARARRTLGLHAAPRGPLVAAGVLAALAVGLLGLAVAQPALETTQERMVRTESQAMFVVDVSRSMRAAPSADAPTRLDRAREVVRELRASVSDVAAGVAGMTDRTLPYLFPTADLESFETTLRGSVQPEAPPPGQVNTVATTFSALPPLASDGFFSNGIRHRACVLVTDGESRTGDGGEASDGFVPVGAEETPTGDGVGIGEIGTALGGSQGCRLVVVRVGGTRDRVFAENGRLEAQYRPDAAAPSKVRELAEAAGGRAFDDGDLGAAAAAVRAVVARGPTSGQGAGTTIHRLAPVAAGAGALLLVVLVTIRVAGARFPRREVFEYRGSFDGFRGGQ